MLDSVPGAGRPDKGGGGVSGRADGQAGKSSKSSKIQDDDWKQGTEDRRQYTETAHDEQSCEAATWERAWERLDASIRQRQRRPTCHHRRAAIRAR